ncbi:MAG: hypothetical protein ACE5DI_04160 [Candidatus Micrarchaeia archaeon]
MGKGQVFTMDFIIALALLTSIIGIALHTTDFSQRRLSHSADLHSNAAAIVLDANLSSKALSALSVSNYCVKTSNNARVYSDNCTSPDFFDDCKRVQKGSNVFSSRRIVVCETGSEEVCVVEVRTCE